MKRRSLTKKFIDSTKADPEKEVRLWDSDVVGLHLRIRGTSRTWALQYGRKLRGRAARITIGTHGSPWTLETARVEARKLLVIVDAGGDPALARKQDVHVTVRDLAARYLEHAEAHKKPASVKQDRSLLGMLAPGKRTVKDPRRKRSILDAIGDVPIEALATSDIARLAHEWRSTPIRANRALALVSHMVEMAIRWGLRKDGVNPAKRVKKTKERGRTRYLQGSETADLSRALDEVEKENRVTPYAIAAIRLLIFSGARASEVLGLEWSWIDFTEGVARLPDSKTGAKTLHLSAPALQVIARLPRVEGNPHLIVGRIEGEPLTLWGLSQIWTVVRSRAGIDDVHLHDLRHSYASTLVGAGVSLAIIGGLLGHASPATTQRYAHLQSGPLKAASTAAGASISAAMKAKPATGWTDNVVEIRA